MKELVCSHCSRHIRIPQAQPGMKVKCPYCQKTFVYTEGSPAAGAAAGAGAAPAVVGAGAPAASPAAAPVIGGLPMRQPSAIQSPLALAGTPAGVAAVPPVPPAAPALAPWQALSAPTAVPAPPPAPVAPTPAAAPPPPAPTPAPAPAPAPAAPSPILASGDIPIFVPPGAAAPQVAPAPGAVPAAQPAVASVATPPVPPAAPPAPPVPPVPQGPLTTSSGKIKLQLNCQVCGKSIRAAGLSVGVQVKCPYCHAIFTVSQAPQPAMPTVAVQGIVRPGTTYVAAINRGAAVAAAGAAVPMPGVAPIPGAVMATVAAPGAVPGAVAVGGAPAVAKPKLDENTLDKMAAAVDKPAASGKARPVTTRIAAVRGSKSKEGGQLLIGAVAVALMIGAIILTSIITSNATHVANQQQRAKEKDEKGRKDDTDPGRGGGGSVTQPPPVTRTVPAKADLPVTENQFKHGWRTSPDLPDNPNPAFVAMPVKVDEVVVAEREVDPVRGGAEGTEVTGKIINTGSDALEDIELRVYSFTRNGSGWSGTAVGKAVIGVVPTKSLIDFRIICKPKKKSELTNMAVVPYHVTMSNSKWVTVSTCKPEELDAEETGAGAARKRTILRGWVQNNSPKAIDLCRVQIDLFDAGGKFLMSVGARAFEYTGNGERFEPGQKKDFEVIADVPLQDIGRGQPRAIGKL